MRIWKPRPFGPRYDKKGPCHTERSRRRSECISLKNRFYGGTHAFFLNEDRHTNNLAVIRNEDTKEYRLCPVFDNGLSLLSDLNDYPKEDDIYRCISKVRAKPFDLDFDEQVTAAELLYGPQLRFSFTRADLSEALAGLEEYYSEETRDRVERVLREQMRKYPVYSL